VDPLVCFAVKANSNLSILRLVTDQGAGLDIVSGGELLRAERLQISGEKIVFSGVGKTAGEMRQALRYRGTGIFSFNVESLSELELLNQVAKQLGVRATVALRFNPDVDAHTHPYVSTGLRENKFGIPYSEVLAAVRGVAAGKYRHLRLQGISLHIGSQLTSLSPLASAFGHLDQLVRVIEGYLPGQIQFVDVGGGLGIAYRDKDEGRTPTIERYCRLLVRHFGPASSLCKDLGRSLRIVLEPGRLIAGNAGVLVTQVLYVKDRVLKGAQRRFLVVDAGMNDLIRPSLYESYHELLPLIQAKTHKKQRVDVVGPVCETGDWFARGRLMPASIQKGDSLALLSAGAYGFSMSSNYNTRPRPAEVLVDKGAVRCVRPREKVEELLAAEEVGV